MTPLLIADDPTVSRLAHALTALHWIAAVLGGCLIVVALLAVLVTRRNQRIAITDSERDGDAGLENDAH